MSDPIIFNPSRNRKKKIKSKIIHRIIITLMIIIGVLLFLLFSKMFKLKNIIIEGNEYYTEQEIVTLLDLEKHNNSLLFYLSLNKEQFADVPFIDSIDMKLLSFNDVKIEVYEKKIIGCLEYMGMYLYFNKDGILVESLDERAQNIPVISGLSFSNLTLYEPIPIQDKKIFKDLLNIYQTLNKYAIIIDKIYINNDSEFVFEKNAKLKILIGTSNRLNEKIIHLKDILKENSTIEGTLYLKSRNIDHGIYLE